MVTLALTFADPSRVYGYVKLLALNFPTSAVFALSPPKMVSITTAYLFSKTVSF